MYPVKTVSVFKQEKTDDLGYFFFRVIFVIRKKFPTFATIFQGFMWKCSFSYWYDKLSNDIILKADDDNKSFINVQALKKHIIHQ